MELGESTAEGAERETTEEAGANFKIGHLFTVMSVPRVGQVAQMFSESEIPWDELAFRTVQETLKHYFADRKTGKFEVHAFNID